MKVSQTTSITARQGHVAAVFAAVFALLLVLAIPAPAHAITRSEVLSRASGWVKARVGYSQRAYYGGYRRDCSGMVSMSWKLGTSLSSRTISRVARKIPISQLKPGDAVLTPGHVAIFAGWANRRAGTYIALEQSSSRTGAIRRVRKLGRATALRYRRIQDDPPLQVVTAPPAPIATALAVSAPSSAEATSTPLSAAAAGPAPATP